MILNKKVFVKSTILNENFFFLSDFEANFFRFVRFRIKFFTTRQILTLKKYNASDFEIKYVRTCQILN